MYLILFLLFLPQGEGPKENKYNSGDCLFYLFLIETNFQAPFCTHIISSTTPPESVWGCITLQRRTVTLRSSKRSSDRLSSDMLALI